MLMKRCPLEGIILLLVLHYNVLYLVRGVGAMGEGESLLSWAVIARLFHLIIVLL